MADQSKSQRLEALYTAIQNDPDYRNERMGKVFVPGCGPIERSLLTFIGEAPGSDEEEKRTPFVGPAGRNLDFLLHTVQLKREDIFITNLIKYRPVTQTGTNRSPTEKERKKARPYLLEELDILRPALTVCLGLSATKTLLPDPALRMKEINGCLFLMEQRAIWATYHPSPHNWANINKRTALQHAFQQIPEVLEKLALTRIIF